MASGGSLVVGRSSEHHPDPPEWRHGGSHTSIQKPFIDFVNDQTRFIASLTNFWLTVLSGVFIAADESVQQVWEGASSEASWEVPYHTHTHVG